MIIIFVLITCAPSRVHLFVIYKAGREPMPHLVIGLYELLGNPTTYLIEPPRLSVQNVLCIRHTNILYDVLRKSVLFQHVHKGINV
jgi:hypothetical protein